MRMIPILLTSCFAAVSALLPTPSHAGVKTDTSQIAKPATIKVLLIKQADNAMIEVKGAYEIYNPANQIIISSGIMSKRTTVRPYDQGINWGEVFPGMFQIRIVPKDAQSFILVNGIQYKGCIEVYQVNDKLNIVNEIDIESYLKSILTTQFTRPIDSTTMDAVAILARTNAYYFISRNPHAYWHVEPQDGNYQGYGLVLQNLTVDRSVERTRHAILTYHGAPFPAAWTKNSAGKTAPFSSIFNKEAPSPLGVEAPLAAKDREKFHWTSSITKDIVAKAAGFTKVASIDLLRENHSGKVFGVKVSDGFHSKTLDFLSFQKAVTAQKLRSNDFTAEIKADSIAFTGFGEGHGVGLCLYSSAILAKHGIDTPKILTEFFPDTQLQKVRSLNEDNKAILEEVDPDYLKIKAIEQGQKLGLRSLDKDEDPNKCKRCNKPKMSEDFSLSYASLAENVSTDNVLSDDVRSDEGCGKCRKRRISLVESLLSYQNNADDNGGCKRCKKPSSVA